MSHLGELPSAFRPSKSSTYNVNCRTLSKHGSVTFEMSNPKKDQKLLPVSNILTNLFQSEDRPLTNQFDRYQLWQKWRDVVGPVVSKYSAPVTYRDGVLWVWVKSSAHSQEMSFGLEFLRSKINQFFGFTWVKQIKLTTDSREVENVPQAEV